VEGLRKTTVGLSQDSSYDRKSNWALPEYMSEMQLFESTCRCLRALGEGRCGAGERTISRREKEGTKEIKRNENSNAVLSYCLHQVVVICTVHIQGVPGGMCHTSVGCSLC